MRFLWNSRTADIPGEKPQTFECVRFNTFEQF